jgi:MoaA/NifB/PqqE/SkfB family radical SAM enzyme
VNQIKAGDPRFCDIVIATKCVLHCKMCKAWQGGQNSKEISFDEAKSFVRSLADFVKFPLEINVMGGEPLLKEWCLDLCSYIDQVGFKSIISTNAYLIDEAMAKKIAASKLSVLAISLESLNPATHDFYRGTPGTFDKVMQAIGYLDKYCRGKMAMTILTIIMEKNLDELLELVEWVNKNDLFVNISFLALLETGLVFPRENWFGRPEYRELWPQDTKKVYRLVDELIRLRKKGYKIWNPVSQLEAFKSYYTEPDKFMKETQYRVHDYIIDLDENGTIYLSGEPLGNIRQDDVRQLWYSDKADQIRKKIDERGPGKRCCVINFVCAFPPD